MSTDVHTLSGAYALHALSVREEAEFESHLEGCDSCRTETDEFRAVTAALGELEMREVPARLRAAVMRGIDEQRQLPPLVPLDLRGGDRDDPDDRGHRDDVTDTDTDTDTDGSTGAAVGSDDGTVSRPRFGRRRRGRTPESRSSDGAPGWRRGLVAAAAAAVLVGGAGVAVSSLDEPGLPTAASQVFAASDVSTLQVSVPGDGSLQVATSASTGQVAVDARDMPELVDGRTYQLWLLRDGIADSVGLLEDGGTSLPLPERGTMLAVTVEPAGGSEQPTTVPVAQVDPTSI